MHVRWLWNKTTLFGMAGIGIAVALGTQLPTQEWASAIDQWLQSLGFWTLPTFILIYTIASVCGFPNVIFMLAAGTVFGLPEGILFASVADTIGAIACFWLGRTLLRRPVKSRLESNSQFTKLDQAVAKKGWKILLLSRLAPIIPSNILNYGFSCTRVKFWQYLICTWLGMLPVVGFYVYIGYFGMNLLSSHSKPELLILQAVGLGLAIAAAVYTTRLTQKTLFQSSDENERCVPQKIND